MSGAPDRLPDRVKFRQDKENPLVVCVSVCVCVCVPTVFPALFPPPHPYLLPDTRHPTPRPFGDLVIGVSGRPLVGGSEGTARGVRAGRDGTGRQLVLPCPHSRHLVVSELHEHEGMRG